MREESGSCISVWYYNCLQALLSCNLKVIFNSQILKLYSRLNYFYNFLYESLYPKSWHIRNGNICFLRA